MASQKNRSFTLIELLTVVAIISLLISILTPAVQRAQRRAKEVAVQAQLDGIAKGLEMFSGDYDRYPDSNPENYGSDSRGLVQGAHRMTMAMIGRDRLGCPSQRGDSVGAVYYYQSGTNAPQPDTDLWGTGSTKKAYRRGTYIDPNGFYIADDNSVAGMRYMPLVCDKFSRGNNDPIPPATGEKYEYEGRNVILYYRARPGPDNVSDIYTVDHNYRIVGMAWDSLSSSTRNDHFFWGVHGSYGNPRGGIVNVSGKVGEIYPPFRPDTYLLISAGPDNQYFTEDDVVNWNKP